MTVADPKKLHAVLKRLAHDASAEGGGLPADEHMTEATDRFDPAVHELVLSILCHHTSLHAAHASFKRLRSQFVDLNELRIAHASEIAEATGERPSPARDERALRLQAVLRDLFDRECDLSLEHARTLKAPELREYVLSLDGATPFAALRVLSLHLHQPLVAIDERGLWALQEASALSERSTLMQASQHIAAALKHCDPQLTISQASKLLRELCERTQLPKLEHAKDEPLAALRAARRSADGITKPGSSKPGTAKPGTTKPSATAKRATKPAAQPEQPLNEKPAAAASKQVAGTRTSKAVSQGKAKLTGKNTRPGQSKSVEEM